MAHKVKLPDWWPALITITNDLVTRLTRIEVAIASQTQQEERHFMAFIDDLEASVANEKSVDDSIVALLNSIAQALKDAGVDPARQAAVLAALKSEQDVVTAAVVANTPVTPAAAAAKA